MLSWSCFSVCGHNMKWLSQAAQTEQQGQSTSEVRHWGRSVMLHSTIDIGDLVSKSVHSLRSFLLPLFALKAHNRGFCWDVRETGLCSPSKKAGEWLNLWLHHKFRKQWLAIFCVIPAFWLLCLEVCAVLLTEAQVYVCWTLLNICLWLKAWLRSP